MRPWLAAILVFLACAVSRADVVQTQADRLDGDVKFVGDQVKVGQKSVAFSDVLLIARRAEQASVSAPNSLRLGDGQIWPVQLKRVLMKKARIQSPLFAERDIDIETIASIDFVGNINGLERCEAGTLYREASEPLPGALLWIDQNRLAIDSALGVITLGREGLLRYVMKQAAKVTSSPGDDEVRLVDGAIYRGKAMIADGRIELEHAILGKLQIPAASVVSIQRQPSNVVFLKDVPAGAIKAMPIAGTSTSVGGHVGESSRQGEGIRQLVLLARTVAQFQLPASGPPTRVFKVVAAPVAGAKGDARLRIAAGEKVLVEQVIGSTAGPLPLSLELPEGQQLTITVELASSPRLPCGVRLIDPMVLSAKP